MHYCNNFTLIIAIDSRQSTVANRRRKVVVVVVIIITTCMGDGRWGYEEEASFMDRLFFLFFGSLFLFPT